jgi:hypothetical protein
MVDNRESSRPPSDPRPAVGRVRPAHPDRSLRRELAVAMLLGVVLVALGLVLWRRPHRPADSLAGEPPTPSAAAPAESAGAAGAVPDAGRPPPVVLSEARVLACHDRGPKRTPAEQCDHVSPIEKALASAVEQSASCVAPPSTSSAITGGGQGGPAGAGTIEYVADVSFLHHKVSVLLPRAGRSVRDRRILAACATAVRGAMGAMPLDGVDHQHAQYRIAVTATYRGPGGG